MSYRGTPVVGVIVTPGSKEVQVVMTDAELVQAALTAYRCCGPSVYLPFYE